MKFEQLFEDGSVTLTFTEDEFLNIISGIGETLEALEEWEFSTRTGAEMSDFRKLLNELSKIRKDHLLKA